MYWDCLEIFITETINIHPSWRGRRFLHVYCDILDQGLVPDTMAFMLRAILVSGKDNYWVTGRYENLPYILLQKPTFGYDREGNWY